MRRTCVLIMRFMYVYACRDVAPQRLPICENPREENGANENLARRNRDVAVQRLYTWAYIGYWIVREKVE